MTADEKEVWYKDGLRFNCTECGKCCTGAPGYVWLTLEEMQNIADYLKISLQQFKKQYIRQKDNRYALVEKKSDNYACIFLDGKKCKVYPVRPKQCRTFPWWKENLTSKQSWQAAGVECEGINEDAPLVAYSEIVQLLSLNSER